MLLRLSQIQKIQLLIMQPARLEFHTANNQAPGVLFLGYSVLHFSWPAPATLIAQQLFVMYVFALLVQQLLASYLVDDGGRESC